MSKSNANIKFFIPILLVVMISTALYADLKANTKAPDFTLKTLDGKNYTLSENFKENPKVVILIFWAVYCHACRVELPLISDLSKKFDNKNVEFVAVALDRNKNTVAEYTKDKKFNLTILHDSQGEKTGVPYKISFIPATYIIDKKGVIRYVNSNFPNSKEDQKKMIHNMEKEINRLLKEKQ
ncbi:MAG: TlpA disulfide reductase family protein [Armatimonadota bacterium]